MLQTTAHSSLGSSPQVMHSSAKRAQLTQVSSFPAIIEPDDHLINHVSFLDTALANSVLSDTGEVLEYRNLIRSPEANEWTRTLANDLGRLAQGVGS